MITTPFPHQLSGAALINGPFKGRALLADNMGLGKSLTSLIAAKNAGAFPLVVVAPAGLKENWRRECSTHLNLRAEVLEGMSAPSNREGLRLAVHAPVQIINYEILSPWMTHLQLLNPGMVVFDEGHYLSNRSSLRSHYARELSEEIGRVLILTGTPLPNRPADLWNLLNIIRPDLYGDFHSYAFEYCGMKKRYGQWDFSGATNLDELHKRLTKDLMVRRRREDVIDSLPPMRRIVTPIPLKDRTGYEEGVRALLAEFRFGDRAKAAAMTMLTSLSQTVGMEKLPFVFDWIDAFLANTDGKLLCFGIHHAVLEALHARYPKESLLLYGNTPQAKRLRDEQAFQTDPRRRIYFLNIHAGGVGLNLTAADTVAFVEFPWRPADLEQAAARCYARVGDLHGCTTYYLVGLGTVEEYKIELLQRKQGIAEAVVDGMVGASDFDLATQLLEHLRGTA